jgi:2-polyprenyl-3-methyl-5-hydroxy-6-metoxy-1,4-benzoquinol methylase
MTSLIAATFPAESLLDAGCGDGRFLAAVARMPDRPTHLTGCDISERILQTAANAVAREGVAAEFVRANLEQLPFENDSFERVLSVQVIEHLLDPTAGMRELVRVLKPGGTLVLSTDNRRNYFSRALNLPRTVLVRVLNLRDRHAGVLFPHRSFTREEVVLALQRCGVEVEHVETFRFQLDGVSAASVQRLLNVVDGAIPHQQWGDLLAVVARKPGGAV